MRQARAGRGHFRVTVAFSLLGLGVAGCSNDQRLHAPPLAVVSGARSALRANATTVSADLDMVAERVSDSVRTAGMHVRMHVAHQRDGGGQMVTTYDFLEPSGDRAKAGPKRVGRVEFGARGTRAYDRRGNELPQMPAIADKVFGGASSRPWNAGRQHMQAATASSQRSTSSAIRAGSQAFLIDPTEEREHLQARRRSVGGAASDGRGGMHVRVEKGAESHEVVYDETLGVPRTRQVSSGGKRKSLSEYSWAGRPDGLLELRHVTTSVFTADGTSVASRVHVSYSNVQLTTR